MDAIIKKITVFLSVVLCLGAISGDSVKAQSANETEAAAESHLLQVMLPGGAQRVLPQSVPAQITQALEKVIAGSEGKFRQGETEVLLWGGGNYKKTSAAGIVNRLTDSLRNAGWQFQIAGEENGITVFKILQQSPRNRTTVGFYGATDEALIMAFMEIIPNDVASTPNAAEGQTPANTSTERAERSYTKQNSSNGNPVVGTWSSGYSSILSGYTPTVGPKSYTPGRSHYFGYVFHPNGTFEFTGLMRNTVFSCTTWIFNDKRGRYTINGNQITLAKTKNFFRRTDSCSASNNMERDHTLEPETYTFSVNRNDRGKEQICLKDGENNPCYEREQK